MSEILDDMFDEALRFEQEEHVEREYEIEYKDKQISSLKSALKERDAEIARLKRIISELDYELSQYEKPISRQALEARDDIR